MSDNLTIFGTDYTGVTGIKAKSTGNGTLTYVRPTGTKSITENGTAIDVTQYANVDVDVSTGPDWPTFTSNNEGTTITCDKTYAECRALIQDGVTGAFAQSDSFSAVLIALRVNGVNTAEDLHYIYVDNGVPVWQLNYASDGTITIQDSVDSVTTLDVIQNGTYSDGLWNEVEVNVPAPAPKLQSKTAIPTEQQQIVLPDSDYHYDGLSSVTVDAIPSTYVGSGITQRTSSDLTANGRTITAPAGYYAAQASASVQSGNVNSPTASKGTVSNHTIQVTPSVTVNPGYITSGVYNGTAVTVSASELVSGTKNITASGTADVTNYASASVAAGSVSPSATKGTVSNHSIAIYPYADALAGFIGSGKYSGSTVTVRASELVSGSQTITENGTVDVTNLASVDVEVSGYTATITHTVGSTYSYPTIQVNGTGPAYYADGTVFKFNDGDTFKIYLDGKRSGGGSFYFNNTYIYGSQSPASYVWTPPSCDLSINIKTDAGGVVEITTSVMNISENDSYEVPGYGYVNVDVNVTGMSETDLKNLIEGSNSFVDIDWPDGLSDIHPGAFMSCSYFNPSSLPNGVTRIGERAFAGCSNLAITSLPNSITTIEPYAFLGCVQLALTSLPNSITTIGAQAFNNCRSLALTELPSSVTSIGTGAFSNCVYLPLTSLPSGITTIAGSTFLGCSKLALTSLPSGVTTMGPNCFDGCSTLALTSLPSGITAIPGSAFADCTSLALTSLPSGVTSIAANAFKGCTSLTSISCDGVITTMGPSAFNGCSSLTSASFPNMKLSVSLLTVFGSTTAANACQLLKFCDIGSTVGIVADAFANCYALKTLVLRKTASVCSLGNVNAFTNTPMSGYNNLTGKVYVPSALISSYKTATNWKTLYNAGTVTFVAIEGSVYER